MSSIVRALIVAAVAFGSLNAEAATYSLKNTGAFSARLSATWTIPGTVRESTCTTPTGETFRCGEGTADQSGSKNSKANAGQTASITIPDDAVDVKVKIQFLNGASWSTKKTLTYAADPQSASYQISGALGSVKLAER